METSTFFEQISSQISRREKQLLTYFSFSSNFFFPSSNLATTNDAEKCQVNIADEMSWCQRYLIFLMNLITADTWGWSGGPCRGKRHYSCNCSTEKTDFSAFFSPTRAELFFSVHFFNFESQLFWREMKFILNSFHSVFRRGFIVLQLFAILCRSEEEEKRFSIENYESFICQKRSFCQTSALKLRVSPPSSLCPRIGERTREKGKIINNFILLLAASIKKLFKVEANFRVPLNWLTHSRSLRQESRVKELN